MRIAFSGTHCVGKSTLLSAVAEALPHYTSLDEPYHLLEEEGYEHSASPTLEDFIAQLERSLSALEAADRDMLFDRSPADVLAYLLTHEDAESFESEAWIDRIREAMQSLDLVVFVPIEQPERIPVPAHEDRRYRARVHKKLERMLLDDAFDFGVETLLVEGDVRARRDRVLKHTGGVNQTKT